MIERETLWTRDLAGTWAFEPEGGASAAIAVPGGGWLRQGFRCEAGVYEHTLDIPDLGRPAALVLELGAVNHRLECFVGPEGGPLAKIHDEVTAFTGQAVDLTPHVKPGDRIRLRLAVRAWQNGRPIAPHWAEWCECIARGIFRGAHLRAYPTVFVEDMWVETSVCANTATVRATVVNASTEARSLQAEARFATRGPAWSYPQVAPVEVTLLPGERREIAFEPAPWIAGAESWWWPNVPYRPGYRAQLHWAEVALREGEAHVHGARVRFGFRECRQAGDHFELNGVRVNFRGDNLQVANYDRITGGDAIDLLPGFLPPSTTCAGWPGAVENFLRLNYNVQRTHMGPWTPYMLDVCDELGLMLIGESACRWNGFDMQDGRGFHEVKCLRDIVRRDRHHPALVRWSSKNEAQNADPAYHVELYEAIKGLDATRPIFEDFLTANRVSFNPEEIFAPLLDKPDFTWIEHYLSFDAQNQPFFTTIEHNDAVVPLRGRPYGIGEADWMRSSTPAGLVWFAATIALARSQGASDARPYVLLSSWASSVPGVKHTDFLTEENRHPVYGEDNLPDPWSHPGIRCLQQACHPLLALDVAFLKLNRHSDAHGHFPIHAPRVAALERVERTITVFNDEFAGGELTLRWEAREGSPTNRPCDKGAVALAIPPGGMAVTAVAFTAPKFNTNVFLILEVWKGGERRFRDEATSFEVAGGMDFRSEFNNEERIFL